MPEHTLKDIAELMNGVPTHAVRLALTGRSLRVMLISPSGECISANENSLNTLGVSWREIVGRNILELFASRLAPGELEKIQSRLRTGGSAFLRMSWPHVDGSSVPLDTGFFPFFCDTEETRKIMLIAADITTQVERERRKVERCRDVAALVDKTVNAVAITDAAFAPLYVNAAFSGMFGYSRGQLPRTGPTVVFGADEEKILGKIRTGIAAGAPIALETTAYGRHGLKIWVRLLVSLLDYQQDRPNKLGFVFIDITDAKLYELLRQTALEGMARDLPVSEILILVRREAEKFFSGIRVVVFETDGRGELRWLVSPREDADIEAMSRAIPPGGDMDTPINDALRYRHTVVTQDITTSSYPQAVKDLYIAAGIRAVLATPVLSSKKEALGLVAFLYLSPSRQSEAHVQMAEIVAVSCSTVMEWGEIHTALRMFAHYSSVTGLPNLNFLSVLMKQEMLIRSPDSDDAVPVAALCINIERFRRIGKTWGIATANEVLKIVGQRLSAAQSPNALVAHSFEDEFIMLIIGCDAVQAREMGRRIQEALAAPLMIKHTEVILNANIGVSMDREGLAEGPGRLIEEARSALFRIKRGEHVQIRFFSGNPQQSAAEDVALEARLSHAIEQGKLRLCYQPQVSLKDGGIYGVEALCRWQEEDLGAIHPVRFIPLAEESGLIVRLSDWVLREVCRQLGDWRRRNIPVPAVSANLSALNFREGKLLDNIQCFLEENSLEPKDLRLELTETALLEDDQTTLDTLYKARDRGLLLALDDFGTGYSSLSYLHKLPIAEMKLDRSFVLNLHENSVSQRLSRAVLRVGESLGLCVVAEGVESKLQLDLLKQHQYHAVQGFYLAPPLPPEEFERWLETWDPAKVFE